MNSDIKLMRDAFLERVYQEMLVDESIYFLTADFGAFALDKMREDFPNRIFHMGICEQNMVDFAAGLSLSGKRVFLYAMAPFLIARSYEQIKAVVSAMNLPMTFIGVGVGLGYDHATLTHFTPEDFAIARVIRGMNVYTPSDDLSAIATAESILNSSPQLSYVRLERSLTDRLSLNIKNLPDWRIVHNNGSSLAVISSGYMTHVVKKFSISHPSYQFSILDILKNYPIKQDLLTSLEIYDSLLIVEEQSIQGGMAASFCEELIKHTKSIKNIYTLALDRDIQIENGNREKLHEINNISYIDLEEKIKGILS